MKNKVISLNSLNPKFVDVPLEEKEEVLKIVEQEIEKVIKESEVNNNVVKELLDVSEFKKKFDCEIEFNLAFYGTSNNILRLFNQHIYFHNLKNDVYEQMAVNNGTSLINTYNVEGYQYITPTEEFRTLTLSNASENSLVDVVSDADFGYVLLQENFKSKQHRTILISGLQYPNGFIDVDKLNYLCSKKNLNLDCYLTIEDIEGNVLEEVCIHKKVRYGLNK